MSLDVRAACFWDFLASFCKIFDEINDINQENEVNT